MAYLKIDRLPYEEPHSINLHFEASNDRLTAVFEVYCNPTDLSDIGRHLAEFPRHNDDFHLYELGSERKEDRWGYYFRFRVFQTDGLGHCAIQFRFNNNEDLPDTEISEFCIEAEAAQINRLGQLLITFSELKHEVLEWKVTEGELH